MRRLRQGSTQLALAITLAAAPVYTRAQLCNETQTPETISIENYSLSIPGEAQDTAGSNLTWYRCVYGMAWDPVANTCTGAPIKVTWEQALKLSPPATTGGWRLPNIKELLSIVDYQCFVPPLNGEMFPNAPSAIDIGLWSSTPVQNTNTLNLTRAWIVDLGHGQMQQHNVTTPQYVIFVKP